jgi:hypothetical protein
MEFCRLQFKYFTMIPLKKNLFTLILLSPIIILYSAHFFCHDKDLKPSGFIQSEHAIYMLSAKEYRNNNAIIFSQYPLDITEDSPKVFFQPHIFFLGYLWKWTNLNPGVLISIFGIIFSFLTIRIVIEIIDTYTFNNLQKIISSILFVWGGGLLSLAGLLLHFTYFKSTGNIFTHLFFLDPGYGWWCLNFGRALIYPLEAYYHFIFVLSVLLLLKKKYFLVFGLMLLITLSHPYTSIELALIVFSWSSIEYFYLKSGFLTKKGLAIILGGVVFVFIYYGVILNSIPIYKTISKHIALDWGYKVWHFLPAYILVWLMSFMAIKNVSLLKEMFSKPHFRLFFCWGTVAFALSVHGFAIKPIQPIHFTRGYVYAGFFLFSLPALIQLINKFTQSKSGKFILLPALCLIFISDNVSWFFVNTSHNKTGVYYNTKKQELMSFLSSKQEKGLLILPDKHESLSATLQLYSNYKSWIPHPFLTFDIDNKKQAVKKLLNSNLIDENWKKRSSYFIEVKSDSAKYPRLNYYPVVFENNSFTVYKLN